MGEQKSLIIGTAAQTEAITGFQVWTLENPATQTTVFYNVNTAATAVVTQSIPVNPGQTRVFFVDNKTNPNGVSFIAITSASTVNLVKDTFRNRFEYGVAKLAAGVSAIVASAFFTLSGGDTLVPVGPITTIRGLPGASLIFENDNSHAFETIEPGANGDHLISADGTGGISIRPGTVPTAAAGRTILASPDGTDTVSILNGRAILIIANSAEIVDATDGILRIKNAAVLAQFNGNGTGERWRVTSTALIHRMIGDDDADSHLVLEERAIANGDTVSGGQAVEFLEGTTRIQVADGAGFPAGVCVTGGTGNAGGTVKGTYLRRGVASLGVVDDGGVTQGQYLLPGAADAAEFDSQVTNEGTCGLVLDTVASTGVVIASWSGTV